MIYNDQPQMVEATHRSVARMSSYRVLEAAFAAIDREALIVKVEAQLAKMRPSHATPRDFAEEALVAAGVITERS